MKRHFLGIVSIALLPSMAAALDDPLFVDGFDPTIGFRTTRLPDRNDAAPCSGAANAGAQIVRAYVMQTSLVEPTHPFFVLAANRPTLVKVDVTGSGASPQVRVAATNNGNPVGSLCLAGPASLPASVDPNAPSRANSFTATLPAAWMQPGLSLTLTAGTTSRTYDAAALKIGAEPVLSLIGPDLMLFGDTVPTAKAANWEQRYLSILPVSALQYTPLAPIVSGRLPIQPRSDGRNANGVTTTQPAMIATVPPSCTAAQQMAGTCTLYGGFGYISGGRQVSGAILKANGMERYAQAYGTFSANTHGGGGLAGGGVGAGDDYGILFSHEMGHSADMPHWGDAWYGRAAAGETRQHPYAGEFLNGSNQPLGGGFGNTWGYDYASDTFVSPTCAANGKERQEPMQRNPGNGCLPAGIVYDLFSDYSALFAYRFFVGAPAVYSGTLPYPRDPLGNAAATPFSFPTKSGMVVGVVPNGTQPLLKLWDTSAAAYVVQAAPTLSANQLKHWYPQQYNVKVATIWGAFSNTTAAASMIGPPMHYTGNLKKTWNPADTADFADLKSWVSGDAFYFGADLVVRVNYTDSSFRQAVVKVAPRSTDALSTDSHAYWAVNLPDDRTIASIVLYQRPMEVRNPGENRPYNINYTGSTATAANYMSTAIVAANWP